MKSLSNRLLALIVLLLFLSVLFLAFQAWHTFQRNRKEQGNVGERHPFSYSSIDRLLQLGAVDEAVPLLHQRLKESRSAADYLSLAKRALHLAELAGDYTFLEQVAVKGAEELPGREDLLGLFSYALLRQGRLTEAENVLERIDRSSLPFMESLQGEILWKSSNDEAWNLESPAGCDGETLLELANTGNNPALLMDALICFLLSEETDRALELAETFLNQYRAAALPYLQDPGPLFFSLFADQGHYQQARASMETGDSFTRQEQLLLSADLHLLSRRFSDAVEEYKTALDYFPEYSWIPYYNLQLLEPDTGSDTGNEYTYLKEALPRFNTDERFLKKSIILLYADKSFPSITPFLDAYKTLKEDPFSALIEQMIRGNVHPDRYRMNLLELAEIEADPVPVLLNGVWFFFGLRDYQEMVRLTEELKIRKAGPGSILFTEALGAFLQGRLETARQLFRESCQEDTQLWQGAYNGAMISRIMQEPLSVPADLREALTLIPMEEKQYRSIIYFRLAEHEATFGSGEEARKLLARSLEMNPLNPSARSLKSSLDGTVAY